MATGRRPPTEPAKFGVASVGHYSGKIRRHTFLSFIRECARLEFGITGTTVEEIQAKCLAARPDLYQHHDEENR